MHSARARGLRARALAHTRYLGACSLLGYCMQVVQKARPLRGARLRRVARAAMRKSCSDTPHGREHRRRGLLRLPPWQPSQLMAQGPLLGTCGVELDRMKGLVRWLWAAIPLISGRWGRDC